MWEALLLLLTSNVQLQRREEVAASRSFFFEAMQLTVPLEVIRG